MSSRLGAFVAKAGIRFYQWFISPALVMLMGPGSGCRHRISCSQYFLDAVLKEGWLKGGALGMKRILNCHPWTRPEI